MDKRCPITELLAEQCAHCRSAAPADPFDDPAPARRGRWFRANFAGRCSVCDDAFGEGDLIRADSEGGGYEAKDCEDYA